MKNKQLLAFAMTLSLSASVFAGSAMAATYSDAQGNWAQSDINSVVDMNVMTGFNDGMFHPDAWLTRSEFTTMSAKAVGLPPSQSEQLPSLKKVSRNEWGFSPVDNSAWISAYPAGVYRPENPLRRVELLVGVAGTLNSPLVSKEEAEQILSKYSDAAEVPAGVRQEVATALQNNLFAIDPKAGSNVIAPLQPANRAEIATVLNNLAQHRELTVVRNGQIVAAANSGATIADAAAASSMTSTNAAASNGMANSADIATQASTTTTTTVAANPPAEAPAADAAATDAAAASTAASTTPSSDAQANERKLGIKTPFRNSANTLTESRLVNQTTTPSGLDANMLASLPADTTFTTTVAKALYSEFNKPGDPVLLIVDHAVLDATGKAVIPAGSKLLGAVNEVRSRNESGDEARLGIELKEVITPAGQRLPINGSIANADGVLNAKDLQGVTFRPDHSVEALRREISTAQGSLYGTKVGKSEVLDEPYSAQLSAKPVDAVDKRDSNIVLGVGDHLQVRLGAAADAADNK